MPCFLLIFSLELFLKRFTCSIAFKSQLAEIAGREIIKIMLNSAEHEFILLINVKMPTIVGILTFISMINTTSERL